jgi:hypothetical protein
MSWLQSVQRDTAIWLFRGLLAQQEEKRSSLKI